MMQTRRNDLLDRLCFWILTRRRRNSVSKVTHQLDRAPRGLTKEHATAQKGTIYMGEVTAVILKSTTIEEAREK